MKQKSFIKLLNLSEDAFERLKANVQKAEKNTSGEIVVAVASESSDYSFWELLASVIFALIVFCAMVPFAGTIRSFYERVNWLSPEWYLPATYGFTTFVLILLGFLLFNLPSLDRLIIPSFIKNKKVTNRAFRCFTESGVYCTKAHTGILIFVSFLERQVRIVADKGVSEKISQDMWNLISSGLADELSKGNTEGAFTEAIEKCGNLLAEFFPAKKENPDELSDGIIILGD